MKKAIKYILLICLALALVVVIANPDLLSFKKTGWVEEDGQFYYYNEDHKMHIGWLDLGESVYYLSEDGARLSGWLREGQAYHYFDENGLMVMDGWLDLDDGRYLIRDSLMVTGLTGYEGRNYFFGEDGRQVTGWVDLDEERWYFDPAEGHSLSGLQTIDGVMYAFTADGPLARGWFEEDGVTYYIEEDGTPISGGWQTIHDDAYYFNDDGTLYEGWLEEEGHTCYIQDGQRTTGILALDGRNYFFDSRGWQILMVNPWNTVPEGYEVQTTSVGGGHYIAQEAAVDFSNMVYAMQQQGLGPIITSSYRTGTRQQEIFDDRMAGYMAQGMTEEEAYAKTATSVAIPGTSEHQLGLAMDMTDAYYNKLDEGQMETPTQLWLIENSWKYGFILRYPDGKSEITGIIYEPWHYRYVGKELAAELKELNLTMEEYLDQLTEDKSLTASNPENGNTMK